MMSFNRFLEECKDEPNHHQQNVKRSFEMGWKPLFNEYRMSGKLQDKPGNRQIVLQALDEYKLSDEEAFFILSYTGSYSSWLNIEWRHGWPFDSKCKQYFAYRLNLALDKLPCFNNEYVFRMDHPSGPKGQIIKWFHNHKQQIIHLPYFLSTSKDNYENTEITWRIKTMSSNSRARDLALLTNNKVEKEVLFKNDCYFQIGNIDRKKGIIEMKEVPATTNYKEAVGSYFEL